MTAEMEAGTETIVPAMNALAKTATVTEVVTDMSVTLIAAALAHPPAAATASALEMDMHPATTTGGTTATAATTRETET